MLNFLKKSSLWKCKEKLRKHFVCLDQFVIAPAGRTQKTFLCLDKILVAPAGRTSAHALIKKAGVRTVCGECALESNLQKRELETALRSWKQRLRLSFSATATSNSGSS